VLGDPAHWHPVAGFGRVASALERRVWRPERSAGIAYTAMLVGSTAAASAFADRRLGRSRFLFGPLCVWTVLGGRSLAREALLLADALERGDVAYARERAPALVGRDPSELDSTELARATVESVAENTSDAVVAPLLWCAVAGVPGGIAYRAINTLDAMVGRKSERYEKFGWASARLDDLVNWPAARLGMFLAALCAPIVGGDPFETARVGLRDGGAHPSPNAGRLEAAFAGALGVRLGGRNVYDGRVEARPSLGDGRPPEPRDIGRAVRLSRAVGLASVIVFAAVAR
jgi:adenosylcobinamide-phosphate synthase